MSVTRATPASQRMALKESACCGRNSSSLPARGATEEDQVQALREICEPISGPIIVRTLDVGADKPLPFLPQPEEHNPYLGVRGIRLSLHSPEVFLPHLRAILRSGVGHDIWLMFPMIATQQEIREAFVCSTKHISNCSKGTAHIWPIKRGIMIEVPSAALLAEQLAEDIDFFSIGTNDLTQYTMAAERGNANVADLQDALHPAVLRLMKSVVEGADADRHVSVCGDAASDPLAAAFAGLGIRSFSVRPNQAADQGVVPGLGDGSLGGDGRHELYNSCTTRSPQGGTVHNIREHLLQLI